MEPISPVLERILYTDVLYVCVGSSGESQTLNVKRKQIGVYCIQADEIKPHSVSIEKYRLIQCEKSAELTFGSNV